MRRFDAGSARGFGKCVLEALHPGRKGQLPVVQGYKGMEMTQDGNLSQVRRLLLIQWPGQQRP